VFEQKILCCAALNLYNFRNYNSTEENLLQHQNLELLYAYNTLKKLSDEYEVYLI
jgi:hypothetical protein